MKPDCRRLAELLFDYINGDLDDEGRAWLELHMRECPPCLVYVETYRVTVRLTRRLPTAPMPQDVERRLRAVLAREATDDR
jgi:anti-sigma factor RsiW